MEGFLALSLMVLAGGLGSTIRYVLSQWQGRLPWGILVANSLGGLIAGIALELQLNYSSLGIFGALAAFVLSTGFAGGLSTFSSWAAQTADFWLLRKFRLAYYNAALNLVLPIAAVTLGYFAAVALIN